MNNFSCTTEQVVMLFSVITLTHFFENSAEPNGHHGFQFAFLYIPQPS
jgi:hypothetical protein